VLADMGHEGLEGNTTEDRYVKIERRLRQFFGLLAATPIWIISVRFWRRF